MKKDTLQIYFDSFINQKNQGEFLRGMADYIELAINDKECKKIISDIPKTKQQFILENADSEVLASKRVRLVKKDFQDIFENKKRIKDLTLNGKAFEIKNQQTFEIERKIKDAQGTTLWEAWGKMCLAYISVFKKDKALTDSKQRDEYDAFIFESNPELVREIEQLKTYDKAGQLRSLASPPDVLMKEDYKPFATAVHNHLLKKLDEEKEFFIKAEAGFKEDTKITGDESNKEKDEDVVFEMTYSPRHRKILINGHQVKKFSWESENAKVFEDAYNNPKKIRRINSKRRAQDFVNSFGFTKKAKSLFFPISADKNLMLNNPVRKNDLKELGLEGITLKDILIDIRE